MEKAIIVDSVFDGASHHGAFRQHLRHRWKWWLRMRSFVCLLLLIIGAVFTTRYAGKGYKLPDFISIAFILLGSMGLLRPMIWQMFFERKLRKHIAYGSTIRYTFTAEGMNVSGKAGDRDVAWSAFSELVRTPIGLLIYQSKNAFLWIPKADFNDGEMNAICIAFNAQSSAK